MTIRKHVSCTISNDYIALSFEKFNYKLWLHEFFSIKFLFVLFNFLESYYLNAFLRFFKQFFFSGFFNGVKKLYIDFFELLYMKYLRNKYICFFLKIILPKTTDFFLLEQQSIRKFQLFDFKDLRVMITGVLLKLSITLFGEETEWEKKKQRRKKRSMRNY
jgi:hypothetical protein